MEKLHMDRTYRVLKKLGQGGSGAVYLAEDSRLHKKWALKCLKRSPGGAASGAFSPAAEADMLKELCHPRLPRIVDLVELKHASFLVMDYIEGCTLKQYLEENGPVGYEKAYSWALELTDVLSYLHGRIPPVIYRDLKPENVMVRPQGDLVLLDLGIAMRLCGRSHFDAKGTPGYAAPELSDPSRMPDERSDLYSLGILLLALLKGPAAVYAKRPEKAERCLTGLKKEWKNLLQGCLYEEPSKRYADMKEWKKALTALKGGREPGSARIVRFLYRWKRRRRAAFLLGIALFFTTAVLTAKTLFMRSCRRQYLKLEARAAGGSGTYDARLMEGLLNLIEKAPEFPDAYILLLRTCSETGHAEDGLRLFDDRVRCGRGVIGNHTKVMLSAAETAVRQAAEGGLTGTAYQRASVYYRYCEESELNAGESALRKLILELGKERKPDKTVISGAVRELSSSAENADILFLQRQLLAAQICIREEERLLEAGVRPDEAAQGILDSLLHSIQKLRAEEGTDQKNDAATDALYDRALRHQTALFIKEGKYGDALRCTEEQLRICTEKGREESLQVTRFQLILRSGTEKAVRDAAVSFFGACPDSAEGYLLYASWLYDHDRIEEAKEAFLTASKLPEASHLPSLKKLRECLAPYLKERTEKKGKQGGEPSDDLRQ